MTADDAPTDDATTEDSRTYAYLCIGCPLGCRLEVDEDSHGDIIEIRGSSCRKGDRYAEQEHTDPRRNVTTTVAISGGLWPRLPVKTAGDIPKDLVRIACEELRKVRLEAPAKMGDVVVEDLLGTGCAVVVTRDMPAVN